MSASILDNSATAKMFFEVEEMMEYKVSPFIKSERGVDKLSSLKFFMN